MLKNVSEMHRLVDAFDWSTTPLGPQEAWPLHVKNAVCLVLNANVPMTTLWGPGGTMIYNDAFAKFAANRHPESLGAEVLGAWPEVADFNKNVLDTVLAGGSLSYKDQELTLKRRGVEEQAWLDLNYSPIMDEAGNPAAVLVLLTETTPKVMAERRLAAAHERLQQMFEQAPGFMAVVRGPTHVFELTNSSYMQLTGHRDIVGKTVREALPEVAAQGFIEVLDQTYETGVPFIGTATPVLLQRTTGVVPEERILDFIFQPIREADGQISGIFIEGTDITDRIAAERALQVSEQRFRTFAEAMPNHVWSARPDGHLDWFNDRVYQFSGAARGDLDGTKWTGIVHPEDIPEAAQSWAEALATGETYETEFRLRRADGVWRWHLSRAVLLRDEKGQPRTWVGTNTDIEDQKRDRQQLLENERRLRLSQQAAKIASMEIDIAKDRIVASDSFWEIFGLTPREVGNSADVEALVLPEDAALKSSLQSRQDGSAPPHATYRIRRADTGEIRWIARHMEFLRGPDGAPAMMYGALRDITVEKLAEERQIMLTHELEHRIKNILATVSAIASQTLRGTDIVAARKVLVERLQALGNAHALLSDTHWTSAVLAEVVRAAIAPLPRDRINVAGPYLKLGPKQALSMALAINELGTNSLKYGALSVPEGRVDVTWSKDASGDDGATLRWAWKESGGPAVAAPTRTGFGRFLIEQVMADDFDGAVQIDFHTAGIECRLDAPWPEPIVGEEPVS